MLYLNAYLNFSRDLLFQQGLIQFALFVHAIETCVAILSVPCFSLTFCITVEVANRAAVSFQRDIPLNKLMPPACRREGGGGAPGYCPNENKDECISNEGPVSQHHPKRQDRFPP